ncbi:WD40-repeat-containing domain protein [Mariannaea sp. PMI_226]|nr:WD40-repeat-containing domain protein [Mariannaea sp. PMI_226]
MHPSRLFKSSSHCSASPDGNFIATLSSSTIVIRSTRSLQTAQTVRLPADFSGPIVTLAWSPSSTFVLVASIDLVHVFSTSDSSFRATIRNPVGGHGKPSLIQFGARDAEIFIYAAFGLKLVIFDLFTSKAVEINNPKFYLLSSAPRGLVIQPRTEHIALLTRVSGRDLVSIHHPATRQVQRSWYPETVDAQGLAWTSDGNWLLLWDSPAHGHKILLYTPDGQFFRSIGAPSLGHSHDADLEPGIKLCSISPDSALCAVGDHSRVVRILDTNKWRTSLNLSHPSTIVPKDTLQVWQEQLNVSVEGRVLHTFLRTAQMMSPPSLSTDGKPGCSVLGFDASSTLIATRLDDLPSTLWIWDVAAGELRAVLMFHCAISFDWHPAIRELLLVTCQDDSHRGVSFVWDPLSDGPRPISLGAHLPDGKIVGKPQCVWLKGHTDLPVLLISDTQHYLMVSCGDAEQCPTPWHEPAGSERAPSSARDGFLFQTSARDGGDMLSLMTNDTSTLDDTFSFRNP